MRNENFRFEISELKSVVKICNLHSKISNHYYSNTPVYPNVANLHRGKTRQGTSDVASRSLGQVEAYLTVREILAEASKGADGVLCSVFSGFGRFRFATLGLTLSLY